MSDAAVTPTHQDDAASPYSRPNGGPGRRVPKHALFPHINRARLAEACGVSESAIGKIFYRLNMPRLKLAGRMARELGISVEELVAELEGKKVKRRGKRKAAAGASGNGKGKQ